MKKSEAEKRKAIRYERTMNRLCDRCGRPQAVGMHRCDECGVKHRIRERNRLGCQPREIAWKYDGEEGS